MTKKSTFYLSTKDRNSQLINSLDSIVKFASSSKVIVANASTGQNFQETSNLIKSYSKLIEVIEVPYENDPGLCFVYNDIYKLVDTEYAILWTDDAVLVKSIDQLLDCFTNDKILLVALPMIDDLTDYIFSGSEKPWPTDQFGCAEWMTKTGRCAHYSITKTKAFNTRDVCGTGNPADVIDNFFHKNTNAEQRIWPSDGAYVLHKRITDVTRINTQFIKGEFRLEESTRKHLTQRLSVKK